MPFVNKTTKNGVEYDIRDARFPEGAQIDEVYVIELDGSSEPTQAQLRYIWDNIPAKIKFIIDDSKDVQTHIFTLAYYEEGWDLTYTLNQGKELVRMRISREKDGDNLECEFDSYEVDGGKDFDYVEDWQVDALFPSWKQGYHPGGDTHNVHYDFSNVAASYMPSTVDDDGLFQIFVSASEHYVLDYIYITMGGEDVTSSAWHPSGNDIDGEVRISHVTGDINVTISAQYNPVQVDHQVHINSDGYSWVELTDNYGNSVYDGSTVVEGGYIDGHAYYNSDKGYSDVSVDIHIGSDDVTSRCYDPDKHDIYIHDINEDVWITTNATSK